MKQIARNIAFSLLGFVWPVVIALIATPTILSRLGDASYGIWSLVGNILGYFVIFNSLQTASTKYLAEYVVTQDHTSIRKLLGTSLCFNLGVGTIGSIILFVFAQTLAVDIFAIPQNLHKQSIIAFQLASLGFVLGTIGWWGTAVLSGLQRFDWLTGIMIVSNTLYILGSVIAALSGWGVIGVVVANLIGLAFSAGIYIWSTHYLLPQTLWSLEFDWKTFRQIFSYGFFSTIHVVFGIIAVQLDRTLLGMWVGAAAVGIYSIPLSMASRIHQLCAKGLEVVFPITSSLHTQRENTQLKRLFLRAQNLNMVFVVLISTPLLVLAREILTHWIGSEFADRATLVFQLLVIAYGLLALNVVMAAMVGGFGHPEINAAFAILLGLGNLVGYIFFIPRWGLDGAGMASVFGSIISVPIFLWYINHRFLKISWLTILSTCVTRPLLGGVILAIGLLFLRSVVTNSLSLLIVLLLSCLAYLGTTYILHVWQPEELALLGDMWRRLKQTKKLGAVAGQ